jgi:hypothetical protein
MVPTAGQTKTMRFSRFRWALSRPSRVEETKHLAVAAGRYINGHVPVELPAGTSPFLLADRMDDIYLERSRGLATIAKGPRPDLGVACANVGAPSRR